MLRPPLTTANNRPIDRLAGGGFLRLFVCLAVCGFITGGADLRITHAQSTPDAASSDARSAESQPAASLPDEAPADEAPMGPTAAVQTDLAVSGNPKSPRKAVVIPFHSDINPMSTALLTRKFESAIESGAEVVIFDIHSPGGMVFYTFQIMDMIQDAKGIETVAFIQKDAISGAALIALACDKIYMMPHARMGDAGVIEMGEDGAFRYTVAKLRSPVAQKARDTAEATGRPIALAEKMTDKDLVVFRAVNKNDGTVRYISDREWESMADTDLWERGKPIREAGKEMFFIANGKRCVELGMADRVVNDLDELAEDLQVETPVMVLDRTAVDVAIVILNHWFVTLLLLIIGLVALVIELSAPGMGIGGLISTLCFGLFFWSRFLGGTAGWLEVTLFVLGIVFIGFEIFVIPGFGVAGVGGVGLLLTSLVMASRRFLIPQNSADAISLGWDVLTVLGAFVGFLVAMLFLAKHIGDIPGLGRLTLKPQLAFDGLQASEHQDVGSSDSSLPGWQRVEVGEIGTSAGALRPGGKIDMGDYFVDVVSEGDFIENGQRVQIIAKQGTRIVVRQIQEES
ncbi:NfeD family protein [Roseiconus lacunae]|uniref:NfeD family protein n=1 Tax=Roseiconus lacunae TaxID=2605694 RepID=UPI0011F1DCD3|nr:ATP-dependent Clp protease proteolytic subunit [Roseiconus lacunae]